ncbi:hypothetical protein D9756_008064 [Leucocoprinus leucothites]|uniref:Mug135-like C-terminal domain-containing protein n=1 Tax=Leucocoprinus leucothites TaxID=201217 RepID=A0A8H5D619_9AGAR|nr:hypothetical protein D9756_008064 [Leucoagaricus leucothites]
MLYKNPACLYEPLKQSKYKNLRVGWSLVTMVLTPLPVLSTTTANYVSLPPHPTNDPPEPIDIAKCHKFIRNLEKEFNNMRAPEADLGEALVYEAKLTAAAIGGQAPNVTQAIVQQVMNAINQNMRGFEERIGERIIESERRTGERIGRLEGRVGGIEERIGERISRVERRITVIEGKVNEIQGDIRSLKDSMFQTERTAAALYNKAQGDGPEVRLKVVRFPDGGDPTAPPHNLPPLISLETIRGLNDRDKQSYVANYYPDAPRPPVLERDKLIAQAIGAPPYSL